MGSWPRLGAGRWGLLVGRPHFHSHAPKSAMSDWACVYVHASPVCDLGFISLLRDRGPKAPNQAAPKRAWQAFLLKQHMPLTGLAHTARCGHLHGLAQWWPPWGAQNSLDGVSPEHIQGGSERYLTPVSLSAPLSLPGHIHPRKPEADTLAFVSLIN